MWLAYSNTGKLQNIFLYFIKKMKRESNKLCAWAGWIRLNSNLTKRRHQTESGKTVRADMHCVDAKNNDSCRQIAINDNDICI